ncbi:hypothetical protein FYK55_18065 [Roseiconus nitratireducens]|uniref:Glycosyl transferase family 11 n=1 Tax=Roseiconus nitratireducens TaxID=2605748 RepID=A0A5M6D1Y9_9BACT|nr:alpha-1,2-fucosyltransferase [Roseiconus nitratireducens]KAA5541468.1 hypothetical protein FYK55_18065 [Roseiconus nitratireducens]
MIIIARRYGQLGNRLILFAHLIAAARHYGVELRNPCFGRYATYFPSTRNDVWCRYDRHLARATAPLDADLATADPPRQVIGPATHWTRSARRGLESLCEVTTKTAYLAKLRRFPAHILRIAPGEECDPLGDRFRQAVGSGRPVLVQGWRFRNASLLRQHRQPIIDFFQPDPTDRDAVERLIERARDQCDVLVGVHVRRGDYARFMGGRYYYSDADYARWMHEVEEQLPGRKVRFLICTNGQIQLDAFRELSFELGPGSMMQDLHSLARTDLLIGPPSTYTRWASFYGNVSLQSLDHRMAKIDAAVAVAEHPFDEPPTPVQHVSDSYHSTPIARAS